MRHFLPVLLFVPALLFAQDKRTSIELLMQKANIPGLSLAYIKNGKLAEVYDLGIRNADSKLVVDSSTVFAAASLSKSAFAYGVWKLVEAGKLSLDTPLYRYMEYEDLKHDERYKKITARLVLSHTSGLPNWRNGPVLNFRYDPATRYSYSGEGFVFLQKCVEKITGMKIEPWMQQNVLQPLGMNRSSYEWQKSFESDFAQPHNDVGRTATKYYNKDANMAYSLETTIRDYSKLMIALLNVKGWKKINDTAFFNPQPNSRFKDYENSLGWGLGMGYGWDNNKRLFWQWGDNGTYKALMVGYPSGKEALVYFTNSSNGLSIANDLLALFIAGQQPELKWLGYTKYSDSRFKLNQAVTTQPLSEAIKPFMDKNGKTQDTTLLNEGDAVGTAFKLFRLGRLDEAKELFEMNLLSYPKSADSYEGLGMTYLRKGLRPQAKDALTRAYEIDSTKKNCNRAANFLSGKEDEGKGTKTVFRLEQYGDARSVQLAGSFNGWNDMSIPMKWENGGWTVSIHLLPGEHMYKFVVDGVYLTDPRNPKVKTEDNLNSIVEVK